MFILFLLHDYWYLTDLFNRETSVSSIRYFHYVKTFEFIYILVVVCCKYIEYGAFVV